jgi:hypothetical protein
VAGGQGDQGGGCRGEAELGSDGGPDVVPVMSFSEWAITRRYTMKRFRVVLVIGMALFAAAAVQAADWGTDAVVVPPDVGGRTATGEDDPWFDNFDPAPGAEDVPIDQPIYLQVHSSVAVDPSTITLEVQGEEVSAELTFLEDGFGITYEPPELWDYDTVIEVAVSACMVDAAAAAPTFTGQSATGEGCTLFEYSFLTEPSPSRPKILMAGYGDSYLTSEEGGMLTMRALVVNEASPGDVAEVRVYYEGMPTHLQLWDDGEHGDFEPNDRVFGFQARIPPGFPPSQFLFELVALDGHGTESDVWPYLTVHGQAFAPPHYPDLNELMAMEFSATGSGEGRPTVYYAGFNDTEIDSESGGRFSVLALVDDPEGWEITEVQIYFGLLPTGIFLYDDGRHGDFAAGDDLYGQSFDVPPGAPPGEHLLSIIATNELGVMSEAWPYLIIH